MKNYTNLISVLRASCPEYPADCLDCDKHQVCTFPLMHRAADAIEKLLQIHQLDLTELVRLRRKIQTLLEASLSEGGVTEGDGGSYHA
jgi:hypothetical protein